MQLIYQIIFNLAIVGGIFLIFRKIYTYLIDQSNVDQLFLSVEEIYRQELTKYTKHGLPKFIFLFAFEKKKTMNLENVVSDENREIDTVGLINEVKSYIPDENSPFFFFSQKFQISKKSSLDLICEDVSQALQVRFPMENKLAVIIVNDDVLFVIYEPSDPPKVFAGSSDAMELLK